MLIINYCPRGRSVALLLTINVPVVYMVRGIIILMQENPFRGPLEGVGPENQDFFGPMATIEASAI